MAIGIQDYTKSILYYTFRAIHKREQHLKYSHSRNDTGKPSIQPIKPYTTATHIFSVGALGWSRPPTPEFRFGDTNILVSKNTKVCITPDAKPQICFTTNAKPKGKSVEYRLRWVRNANFLALAMYMSFFLMSISFVLGPVYQWNMDLRVTVTYIILHIQKYSTSCPKTVFPSQQDLK